MNIMAEALLDRNKKYAVRTPDECWWSFIWECETDGEGARWQWVAYRRVPGGSYKRQGIWREIEVLKRLTDYAYQFTDEDRVDLWNWVHKGGLEAFLHAVK